MSLLILPRYAGIMRSKWAINSAFMAFYGFAATLITWVLWAYKMGFGIYMLPFVGRPGPVMTVEQELAQSILPSAAVTQNFPLSTMVYFQFVFAAITIVILAGSLLGRMNFKAWMLFVPLWITFCYTIGGMYIVLLSPGHDERWHLRWCHDSIARND